MIKNTCYYSSKGYPCDGFKIVFNKKHRDDFKPVYHRPRFIKYNDFGEYMENQIKAREILRSNTMSYIDNTYSWGNMYETEYRERQKYKGGGGIGSGSGRTVPMNFKEVERLAMMRQRRLNYLIKRREKKKKSSKFFNLMQVLNVSDDNETVEVWLPDCIPGEESHTFNIWDEGEFKGKSIFHIVILALVKAGRL